MNDDKIYITSGILADVLLATLGFMGIFFGIIQGTLLGMVAALLLIISIFLIVTNCNAAKRTVEAIHDGNQEEAAKLDKRMVLLDRIILGLVITGSILILVSRWLS